MTILSICDVNTMRSSRQSVLVHCLIIYYLLFLIIPSWLSLSSRLRQLPGTLLS